MKKESLKRRDPPKKKILHITRDTRKTLNKEKNGKSKVWEKFNKVTTTTKLFTFIICLRKRIYFPGKHSLEKCSLDYYISSKGFSSVDGNLPKSNETPTPI